MSITMILIRLTFLMAVASIALPSCGSSPPAGREADRGAVQFRIEEVGSKPGADEILVKTWLATYERDAKVARFRIELGLTPPREGSPFSFAAGAFQREPNSQADAFLEAIARALEAKSIAGHSEKVARLPFTAAILGRNLSRGSGQDGYAGAFTSSPAGDWIATKIFLAGGEGEVFLNLNPAQGIGEFSIKDSAYGDIVLRELKKIL